MSTATAIIIALGIANLVVGAIAWGQRHEQLHLQRERLELERLRAESRAHKGLRKTDRERAAIRDALDATRAGRDQADRAKDRMPEGRGFYAPTEPTGRGNHAEDPH